MVATVLPAVKCPKCGRFMGAYVGRSQCPSCHRWNDVPLMVLDKQATIDRR